MYDRWYAAELARRLARPYVHLLFGARQTGKSTLLRQLLPADAMVVDLADPKERTRHLADAGAFEADCRALPRDRPARFVFVDEAQSVPSIFDAVQHLYDRDKTRWRFVLCGSSARKLRVAGTNLLPGRSFYHQHRGILRKPSQGPSFDTQIPLVRCRRPPCRGGADPDA